MKTFEEFKAAIKNGELKADMEELAKTVKGKAEHEKDVLFCEFAKKLGYDVSVEDLAAQKAAAQEMSDEEMEAVAGGGEDISICGILAAFLYGANEILK